MPKRSSAEIRGIDQSRACIEGLSSQLEERRRRSDGEGCRDGDVVESGVVMLEFVFDINVARAIVGGRRPTVDFVQQATIGVSNEIGLR